MGEVADHEQMLPQLAAVAIQRGEHAGRSGGKATPVDMTSSGSRLSALPRAHLIALTLPNRFPKEGIFASSVQVPNWNGKCTGERALGMAEEHETCIEGEVVHV
jgi:hypothetical protein